MRKDVIQPGGHDPDACCSECNPGTCSTHCGAEHQHAGDTSKDAAWQGGRDRGHGEPLAMHTPCSTPIRRGRAPQQPTPTKGRGP